MCLSLILNVVDYEYLKFIGQRSTLNLLRYGRGYSEPDWPVVLSLLVSRCDFYSIYFGAVYFFATVAHPGQPLAKG